MVNRGVSFPLDPFNRVKYHVRLAGVITVCEDIRQVVIRSGRLDPDDVHVVYAGVDPGRFDPDRADGDRIRREWGLSPGTPLLVQVGAREWKGWRDLLGGAALLAREFPALTTAIVACRDEAQKREVLEFAGTLGIGERTLAIGFRQDMPDVLAAADVVADLSYEGLGITGTLREAMALERPVIASSAGGNPELVVDGESGLLVPPRDPPAFAAALARLLADPALARRLAKAGGCRVRENFSVEVRLDRIERLYRRFIAGRSTTGERGEETAAGT